MKNIKQIIEDNQNEFNQMVVDFITEKTDEKETKQRSSKTICHFKVLGETFNSNKFVDNYEKFLFHISVLPIFEETYYKAFGTFITDNVNDFPPSFAKSSIIYLPNGLKVATYSSTEKKLEHITKMCDLLNINMEFNMLQN
jgi:hypothetical protein